MSTEVNISYFRSILGNEILKNEYDPEYTEYIFYRKNYFIQAIVNKSDTVNAYSITTLSKKFNPAFFEIKLGKDNYIDLHKKLSFNFDNFNPEYDDMVSLLGAHDYFYTEGYYRGSPLNYQRFYFSTSQVGFIDYEKPFHPTPDILQEEIENRKADIILGDGINDKEKEILNNYYHNNTNTINTFTITSPYKILKDFNLRDMYAWVPDHNQIRVLNTINSI